MPENCSAPDNFALGPSRSLRRNHAAICYEGDNAGRDAFFRQILPVVAPVVMAAVV